MNDKEKTKLHFPSYPVSRNNLWAGKNKTLSATCRAFLEYTGQVRRRQAVLVTGSCCGPFLQVTPRGRADVFESIFPIPAMFDVHGKNQSITHNKAILTRAHPCMLVVPREMGLWNQTLWHYAKGQKQLRVQRDAAQRAWLLEDISYSVALRHDIHGTEQTQSNVGSEGKKPQKNCLEMNLPGLSDSKKIL